MFSKLLPQRVDNTYDGHWLALWIFALIVSMKILQSLLVIFNGQFVLSSADGIPLDTYTPAGAETVIAAWALLGLSRLIVFMLCVLVLARYRSAIPFMFVVIALDFLGAQLILHFIPLIRTGTPPGPFVNRVLFGLAIVGLVLSLSRKGDRLVES